VQGSQLSVFSPVFQHRSACTERKRSRVEMDLTYIIQKFSILRLSLSTGKLERKQDDGVFSRVSTSSGVEMEFVLDTSTFAQYEQIRT
jgi:hypothetical protein